MARKLFIATSFLLLASALASCQEPERTGPSVGTNSNWLRACAAEDPCTAELTACTCGACTMPCATDADCDQLADARCAIGTDPAAAAACRNDALASGICLPRCAPGSCAQGQACVAGACVLAALPDVAFCADVEERDGAARESEEDLLALLDELRTNGGESCGDAGVSSPAPALRFDARLVCAARVLAEDLARTRAPGPTDSSGRTTQDRMRQAGYTPRLWADSYALEVTTTAEARDLMLSDPSACARLVDPAYVDIGVGRAGDVLVATIGAE